MAARTILVVRMLAFLIFVILTLACAAQQTNVIYGYSTDAGLAIDSTNTTATATLLYPNPRVVNNFTVRQDPIVHRCQTNGYYAFTNLQWGRYTLQLSGRGTTWQFVVSTNTSATVAISTLIGASTQLPPNPATNYYNQAQVDALIAAIPTSSTTFIYTNGGPSLVTNANGTVTANTNTPPDIGGKLESTNGVAIGLLARSLTNSSLFDTNGNERLRFAPGAVLIYSTNGIPIGAVTVDGIQGGGIAPATIATNSMDATADAAYRNDNSFTNGMNSAWAAGDAAVSNSIPNISSTYLVSRYGATNDCVRLDDVRATNGSAVIFSATAAWAAGDVGKVAMLYQDLTNRSFLRTTISSVQSAGQITLAANSGATITGTFRYGTDNTLSISNTYMAAYNAGGGTVVFDRGQYLVAGEQVGDGYFDSVFKLPATFIRANVTNKTIAVEFLGAFAPSLSYSSQSNGPAEAGTIIYIASTNNTGQLVRPQALFAHNYPGDKALEQYTFRNLTFRQPVNPQLWPIHAESGGGLDVDSCMFDVDFPKNYLPVFGIGTNLYVPPSHVETSNYIGAVRMPSVANNSNSRLRNSTAFGFGVGFVLGEHTRAENLNVQLAGTGLLLDGVATHSGPNVYSAHLLNCRYPIASIRTNMVVSASDENWVDLQNIELEGHDYTAQTIYDPGHNLRGSVHFVNDTGTNINDGLLNVHFGTRRTELKTGTTRITGDIAYAGGFDAINSGLVFDWPVRKSTADNPNNATEYFSHGPYHEFGQFSGSIPLTNSPDGIGVAFGDATSVSFTDIYTTNKFPWIQTNVTLSLLVMTTNNNIHYVCSWSDVAFPPYTGDAPFLFYIANTTQIGWRTKNTNGTQVTVTADPPLGLADGLWHLVTGTYDGTNMVVYVDGAPLGTNAQAGPLIRPTGSLIFGGCNVAHPRIWNRALSALEIANLAASRKLDKLGRNDGSSMTNLSSTNLTGTIAPARLANTNLLTLANSISYVVTVVSNANGTAFVFTNTLTGLNLTGGTWTNATFSGPTFTSIGTTTNMFTGLGWVITNGANYITLTSNGTINASGAITTTANSIASQFRASSSFLNSGGTWGWQMNGTVPYVNGIDRFNIGGTTAFYPQLLGTNGGLVLRGGDGTSSSSNSFAIPGIVTATSGFYFASGTGITNAWLTNATLDFPITSVGAIATLTVNLTNASDGDMVLLSVPAAANSMIGSWNAQATNGYVLINFVPTLASQDPPSGNFRVVVEKWK